MEIEIVTSEINIKLQQVIEIYPLERIIHNISDFLIYLLKKYFHPATGMPSTSLHWQPHWSSGWDVDIGLTGGAEQREDNFRAASVSEGFLALKFVSPHPALPR
jgi:hypothetical protein